MKTRFLRILFAAICVLGLLPAVYAAAAVMPTVAVNSPAAAVKPGDTVTVKLSIKDNTGIAGLQLKIGYNGEALALPSSGSVVKGSALGGLAFVGLHADTYRNNPFAVMWNGAENDSSNGDILNIEFKVLSNAKSGTYPITVAFVPENTMLADRKLIALNTVNGSVVVEAPSNQKGADDDSLKGTGAGNAASNTVLLNLDGGCTRQNSFAPFIQGFDDNTFRGATMITREQFVAILYRLKNPQAKPPADQSKPSFKDVAPARWSYDAIEWAKKAGIADADAEGNFRPAEPLARAAMAVMLVNADKLTQMAADTFSDLSEHPDRDDILRAVKANIFTGYTDGTFRPEGNSTRYEAVTALVRYLLGAEPEDRIWQNLKLTFTDVPPDLWAYKYTVLAVNGYDGL